MLLKSLLVFLFGLYAAIIAQSGLSSGSKPYPLVSQNTPPVVKMVIPKHNSNYPLNALVRYSITVSDREDGESKFDEIPAHKILLEIKFVEGTPDSLTKGKHSDVAEPVGLGLIKNSDCFTCHQYKSRLIGPSFTEIATRYQKGSQAVEGLGFRIREGSKGVWGEAIMPAHADVSEDASRKMASWILDAGSLKNVNYLLGNEGTFRLELPDGASKGFFVLKATYTDKGSSQNPGDAKMGQDLIVIGYQ